MVLEAQAQKRATAQNRLVGVGVVHKVTSLEGCIHEERAGGANKGPEAAGKRWQRSREEARVAVAAQRG